MRLRIHIARIRDTILEGNNRDNVKLVAVANHLPKIPNGTKESRTKAIKTKR
jgi:hypothetical protein